MTNMTNELIKEREMQNIRTNSLEAIDIAEAVIYVLKTPERVEVSENKIHEILIKILISCRLSTIIIHNIFFDFIYI